jgi:hypothetical protein
MVQFALSVQAALWLVDGRILPEWAMPVPEFISLLNAFNNPLIL